MTVTMRAKRRYTIGAELVGRNETHFRVWSPKADQVDIVLEEATGQAKQRFTPLTREEGGYFSGSVGAGAGSRYRFRLNGGDKFYPDPASRHQPEGPHGWSAV